MTGAEEAARLEALHLACVLDTPAEPAFDDLAQLAAQICDVPIALVSLVDRERQWFKARIGLDAPETPRSVAFCAHAIQATEPMVVTDARIDPRFRDNPLVTGAPRVVFYAGVPLITAQGHALGTLCVIDHEPRVLTSHQQWTLTALARQVTTLLELRRRTAELEETNRRLHVAESDLAGFFSLSLELMTIAGTDGYFKRLNPYWATVLGFSLDELCAEPFIHFVHPDDQASTNAEAARIGEGATTLSFENRFRTKAGGYRWLQWSAALAADRLHLYAVARDVTSLKVAEAALRDSEQRQRAILDATVDGVLTIDLTGRVHSVNPAVERIFGYAADEIVGRNVSMLMTSEHSTAHDGYLDAYATTGVPRVIGIGRELVARRKNGLEFPIHLAVGEFTTNGERRFAGVIQDITSRCAERIELEAQGDALRRATLAATAASRLKSEFLANMSHELRTPLNGILGFARLLRDAEAGDINDDQREFLGHILTSGEHLLQLINDILDLSKVEAGKLQFHPVPCDALKIVTEVHGIVRELASKKRIRITLEVAPGLGMRLIDPARLKQILYNYLSNAIKFTPDEGVVTVSAVVGLDDLVRFEVVDSGIGIAADDLDKLFKEFSQVDGSASKKQQGTGLGLALTKRLVEEQGGTVGVTSVEGAGSTFFATLPCPVATAATTQAVAAPTPTTPTPTPAPMPTRTPGRPTVTAPAPGQRILVIEDDAKERAWLRRTLGEAGYLVDTAATGAEAIQRATNQGYDALTLDLFLPDMTGWDALTAIRKLPLNCTVPTIVVTVVADDSVAVGYPIAGFLSKPANAGDLAQALARCQVGSNALVLVIDDDAASVSLASSALKARGYRVMAAPDGLAGLELARAHPPHAIVLDLMMPRLDGFGFLDRFRRSKGGATTPVIVWSSKHLEDKERAALQAAAQAVVLKGAGASESLLAAVAQELGRPT